MSIKVIGKVFVILVISVILSPALRAQERNDVIQVYNEGAKAMQTDIKAAIEAFEKVVVMSDKVGEEVADLREKATQVLPGLYFKVAYNAMNEKKPAPEVLKAARAAVAVSEKYGKESTKANAEKIILQTYNTMAAGYFSKNDFDNALLAFDSLLMVNPDYLSAIYNKSLIYIKQGNADSFEKTIDIYLEKIKKSDKESDKEQAQKASTMALEYFRSSGSKAIQDGNLDEALVLLNKSARYGDNADLCYFLADVYNKKEDFDKADEYAQKGIDLETGDASAKAKFYYQLALAQLGNEETSEACESFKNAQYGDFEEAAKAQRTNLGCE